jgi:MFS family permease
MSETTPPQTRGRYMALLNSFYYVGQILASGICIPLGLDATTWAWRAPLLLQAAPAVINLAFVLFLPESPRWLYANGRTEDAVKVLAMLHSRTKDVNSPLVKLEIGEIEESISLTGGDKRWWDPRPLVADRAQRYRLGMGVIVAVWQTLAGNGLVTCACLM